MPQKRIGDNTALFHISFSIFLPTHILSSESKAFYKSMKTMYTFTSYSYIFSTVLLRENIGSVVLLFFRYSYCSSPSLGPTTILNLFSNILSYAFAKWSINVIPLQFRLPCLFIFLLHLPFIILLGQCTASLPTLIKNPYNCIPQLVPPSSINALEILSSPEDLPFLILFSVSSNSSFLISFTSSYFPVFSTSLSPCSFTFSSSLKYSVHLLFINSGHSSKKMWLISKLVLKFAHKCARHT